MPATATRRVRNADPDWDQFDPGRYHAGNYAALRPDDARIIEAVRDYFASVLPIGAHLHGVDVGTGSNLAPALTLAPHCETITLVEYSAANVAWLHQALAAIPDTWEPFWNLVATGRNLIPWNFAKAQISDAAAIQQRSIFELPWHRWEIGTMFFTAESLTEDADEFESALARFIRALKPGAPFAAAFMEHSTGYEVAGVRYPAVPLDQEDLVDAFAQITVTDLQITRVGIDPAPIRAGYSGYLLATGRA